jgi:hypothetical protein
MTTHLSGMHNSRGLPEPLLPRPTFAQQTLTEYFMCLCVWPGVCYVNSKMVSVFTEFTANV